MICIDCQKSYDGSGIRCIRCTQLFEKKRDENNLSAKVDGGSVNKFQNYKRLIYLGVALSVLDLIKMVSIWAMFNYWQTAATTAPMLLLKVYLMPWMLVVQALLILGVAKKSRIAALLLFSGYCFGLYTLYGTLGSVLQHPLLIGLFFLYLGLFFACIKWHRIKNRLIEMTM